MQRAIWVIKSGFCRYIGISPQRSRIFRRFMERSRQLGKGRSLRNGRSSDIPLLAPPQGGVAASSKKISEATEADAAGVVFRPPLRLWVHRKTTPDSRSAEASQCFIDRSTTPPCGD